MSEPRIIDTLDGRPLVLDGGLGTLLEARGHDLSSSLWSARLLRDDPDEVRAAHAEFAAAGADVLITSSYQVGYEALAAEGLGAAEVDELLRASVRLAREAADESGRDVLVAASVGPYGAVRADGSEYTGVYDVDAAALRLWHRRRLQVLAEAGADLIAVETLPSLAEVEAVAAELAGTGAAAWISLSGASTGFTRETRAAALAVAAEIDEVVAVGVNCCSAGLRGRGARRRARGCRPRRLSEQRRAVGRAHTRLARRRRRLSRRRAQLDRRRRTPGGRMLPHDPRRHRRPRRGDPRLTLDAPTGQRRRACR